MRNVCIKSFNKFYDMDFKLKEKPKGRNQDINVNEIGSLKNKLSTKDKIISKLQTEKEKIKQKLQKFKGFWHNIMSHFHKRICYDKDNNYKIVIDYLCKSRIFDNNDIEIANNIDRRVTI